MATQTDPSRQPHKSKANSSRETTQNAQPEIVSSTVTRLSRFDPDMLTDEQRRELIGAPAEPADGERVLSGHIDGDGVVARPHVRDERERDPLGAPARHDKQRVFEDVQVDGGSRERSAEPDGIPKHARLRRGDPGPRVAQFPEQLSAHPAEPAELKRARADHCIDNNGSLEDLERDVDALWSSLQRDSQRTNPIAGKAANAYVETQSEARVS